MSFLPISFEDMNERGWEQLDFLYISGDAYVDHPSFGHAIITRVLESEGFKIGIIAQPNWKDPEAFKILGRPKYGVLVSSGVIDSMVNHYTASKKRRSDDLYSPGGKSGKRPDRAVIVYANRVKEVFKDTPVIIGGIEASLRRFAHYDYWDDKVRRSILVDSKADMLVYGMGEKPLTELAKLLKRDIPISSLKNIRGTCYLASYDDLPKEIRSCIDGEKNKSIAILPSFEDVEDDKMKYAEAFKIQYNEQDAITGKTLVQKHGDRYLVQNPPALPMEVSELDKVYALPYERTYHPSYKKYGGIPAINEVEFSITSHRGCYGGCSFCALNFHQGRVIQKRSQASVLNEAQNMVWAENFKGYIHDVGGPTANFRNMACKKQVNSGVCKDRQCLHPQPCKNLVVDHTEYLELLRKIREIPEVKKVFIRSGIRYDYLMLDKNDDFFEELCEHHISGQLKVAPEHVVDSVLEKMGKPKRALYDKFVKKFYDINEKIGKEQYLVPYLISSHPGSDLRAAIELAEYLKEQGYMPEQVQDFYPTPGTLSTCMFYTEIDPRNMKSVYVPKTGREKAMQRALLQYRKKENYRLVSEALKEAGREDLIGFGPNCLIKPTREEARARTAREGSDSRQSGSKQSKHDKGKYDKQSKHDKQGKYGRPARDGAAADNRQSSSKQDKQGKFGRPARDGAAADNRQSSSKQDKQGKYGRPARDGEQSAKKQPKSSAKSLTRKKR